MSNALKTKIYEAVQQGERLTEAELAKALGEATVSGSNQVRLSVAFINAMDTMVAKKWLKFEVKPGTNKSRSKRVVVLGPEPMPSLGPDNAAIGGPPITVYRDASVINRMTKEAVQVNEKPEIVSIQLPPNLLGVAKPKAVATAAKDMSQPTASTTIKTYEGTPNDRAIAVWEDLIESGKPFRRSTWCRAANIPNGAVKRWVPLYEAVDDAIEELELEKWSAGCRERYKDLVRHMLADKSSNTAAYMAVEPVVIATDEDELVYASAVVEVPKMETPVADIAHATADPIATPVVSESVPTVLPVDVVGALQQQVDKMGHEIAQAMQQIEHYNQEIVHLSQWAAELAEKKSVLTSAIEVLS